MPRYLFLLTALFLFTAPVFAGSHEQAKDPAIKVDVEQVVALGTVTPVDGITSSGQPTEAALQVFADAGYVAVVDLRRDSESRGFDEAAAVEALGMSYVSLPVDPKGGINFENASALNEALAGFDGPVLVHCGSGNRVGALVALGAVLDGSDHEAAIEEGRAAGLTKLEEQVREVLEEK